MHLEREMRLNGQGAPDETTVAPLNFVDVEPADQEKETNQRGYYFQCGGYGHSKAQCCKLRKRRYQESKVKSGETNSTDPPKTKM